jgi:cell fate (sporulation/competence/biofilm development) regulator YlbF (YheA/YmcA/DUF963 family)
MKWYKDRDFPEVKISNSDILAVIERPKELERVIQLQNELVDKLWLTEEQRDEASRQALQAQSDFLNEALRVSQLRSENERLRMIINNTLKKVVENTVEEANKALIELG